MVAQAPVQIDVADLRATQLAAWHAGDGYQQQVQA
jgi:hypothetical protein